MTDEDPVTPEDGGTAEYAEQHVEAAPDSLTRWPLLLVLLVMCAGGVVAWTGHWRWASMVIGCGVGLAAVLRLVLPDRVAGLLVVRSRWFDVVITMLMAAAILTLTLLVPPVRHSA